MHSRYYSWTEDNLQQCNHCTAAEQPSILTRAYIVNAFEALVVAAMELDSEPDLQALETAVYTAMFYYGQAAYYAAKIPTCTEVV